MKQGVVSVAKIRKKLNFFWQRAQNLSLRNSFWLLQMKELVLADYFYEAYFVSLTTPELEGNQKLCLF